MHEYTPPHPARPARLPLSLSLSLLPYPFLKMGLYNRNFAKQRVAGLDRELGKDGEMLDLAKVKKWLMHGKKESSCSVVRGSRPSWDIL